MLSQLRQASQPLARSIARPLAAVGVSPDSLTLAGLASGALAGLALGLGWPRLALTWALVAVLADWLDGPLARTQARESPEGSLLDAVADRCVEGALLVGLAGYFPRLASACLLLSLLISYIKARTGLVVSLDNSDWPGWGDRADRVCLLLLAIAALPSLRLASYWLLALLLVSTVGCLQRLAHARRLIAARAA